jgi:xylan 1,4-beta-xylosidase
MLKRFILITICLSIISASNSQGWKNPVTLEGEWSAYGIGDPYILKHRGQYYLYCSTKDWETGVKAWSSKDLINWTYEGLCSTDPITKSAFAPEVIYWKGMFYMYTSPAGGGHYVLSSASPTGPFIAVSSNYGKWIDGSVYIDDDGSWYFYHASPSGIQGCTMDTPATFGESKNLNAQMNKSWTEGPCVFKRNGRYYMIYTGNHLRTAGYRIDYGSNATGPIDSYEPASLQNPILINTLGDHIGLGHGTVFIGPDLDSYFITYHSMVQRGPRLLNFDRIAWNGEKMILLGDTDFEQQAAALPDAYDYFDRTNLGDGWILPNGGSWSLQNNEYLLNDPTFTGVETWYKAILDSVAHDNFTAEFNLKEITKESDDARAGAVFSYVDEGSFAIALLHGTSKKLEVNFLNNNVWGTPVFYDLPADFDFSTWHSLRIERFDGQFKFFVDGLFKGSKESASGPGKIGYLSSRNHVAFDFLGFSNKVNGSGIYNVYKPVPGTIDAVLYNKGGEGVSYHEVSPQATPDKTIRSDEAEIISCPRGGYAINSVESGEWFNYNINVELDGLYNCEFVYASESSSNTIRILIDDTDVSGTIELPSTGGRSQYRSFVIKDIQLPAGYHTMKVESVAGDFHFYSIRFVAADNDPFKNLLTFEFAFGKGWEFFDGNWSILDGKAAINGFGKRTFGSALWTDYTVDTDIILTKNLSAGLIFRVNNPAAGGADDNPDVDPELGTNFFQGYSLRFTTSNIILTKHNYDSKILKIRPGSFSLDTKYHLRVVVVGSNIRAYVDDMLDPVINYTDTIPFINGMAGYRSSNTDAIFDNFRITSDTLTSSVNPEYNIEENIIRIFPNPASEIVYIEFPSTNERTLKILSSSGKEVYNERSTSNHMQLPLKFLDSGLYFIQVLDNGKLHTHKLILH